MQRNKVEVRLPGVRNSTKRIATETESAKFWSDFSYTLSPADHWNDIASRLPSRLCDALGSGRNRNTGEFVHLLADGSPDSENPEEVTAKLWRVSPVLTVVSLKTCHISTWYCEVS